MTRKSFKLDYIMEEHAKDIQIDDLNLDGESLKIPQLHNKYYKILVNESIILNRMNLDLQQLEAKKYEFYSHGGKAEEKETGWTLPPRGNIIRQDIDRFLNMDKDLIDAKVRVNFQKEKVKYLEEILNELNRRSFNIGNAIKFKIWKDGGSS